MANEDKTGVYTVEIGGHAIGSGWTTIMADSAVDAATKAFNRAAEGYPLEQDGEPDGEVVLVVRAVAGFHRRITEDLADAIR